MDIAHRDLSGVFQTERLLVRPATAADVDLYLSLWTNPEVMHFVGFPHGLRVDRDELLARLKNQPDSAFERLLVVVRIEDGTSVGECLMHLPDEAGVAEPDVKLLPEFWGSGYGAEVWEGLVSYLFDHTDCDVVQSSPNVKNIASIKMMEKVGGMRVGEDVYEFPEAMQAFTTPVHCYIYQVSRNDWESLHDRIA